MRFSQVTAWVSYPCCFFLRWGRVNAGAIRKEIAMKPSPLTEALCALSNAEQELRELLTTLHKNYHALTISTIDTQGHLQAALQALRDFDNPSNNSP